jgi:uncharacterized protein YdaU (DUF1376 family)
VTDTTLPAAAPDEKVDAWMPLWIGAYLADTMRLTTKQHGAYLLLLFAYWRNRGPLEDDDEDLASTVKATLKEWRTELRPKLERFFDVDGGLWSHGRADKELAKAGQHKQAVSNRGKAGAAARWGKARSAYAQPKHATSNAQAQPELCPTPSPSSIPSVQKKKSARTHAPPPPPAVEPSALVEVGFTPELAAEFIAHKARLKAPLTPLAWADHQREAAKARWSPLQAAEKVMAKGWKGFEAKYVADERPDRPAESFAQRAARERVEAIAPGVARKAPTTTKPLMEVFDVSARRLD